MHTDYTSPAMELVGIIAGIHTKGFHPDAFVVLSVLDQKIPANKTLTHERARTIAGFIVQRVNELNGPLPNWEVDMLHQQIML